METNQRSSNQIPVNSQAQTQQASPTNSRLFVFAVISTLLTAITVGSLVYFWQRSVNKKVISGLEQKITFLEEQISTMRNVEVTAQPTSSPALSPTPVTNLMADWKSYNDTANKFSLKHPPSWQATKGNEHAPSIPSSMTEIIKLQSTVGTIDISIIPWHNNLKKDLREELSSFISGYFGGWDVSYENTQVDEEPALRGSYIQSAMGSQTKVIFTAVEKDGSVFFFQTQFDLEDSSRFDIYSQILSTFQFTN